jgi:hypothetical protein
MVSNAGSKNAAWFTILIKTPAILALTGWWRDLASGALEMEPDLFV